jgi:DnaJ-class molecular chaperone
MSRLPPHLAVVQSLFNQMTKTCRGCSGTGELDSGRHCNWCDPSGDVPDVTPEEVERLKAVEKEYLR